MAGPEKALSLRQGIVLDGDQKSQYREAIMPFVLAAREAYRPIKGIKSQIRHLDSEQRRIEEQIAETNISFAGKHPLTAALTGIKISKTELQRSLATSGAEEEFRLRANELIAEVNSWRAKSALSANLVTPAATALIGRPQIPRTEGTNKFQRPESPVRPHNALGALSIYREKDVRPDLANAIRTHSKALMASSMDAADIAIAMVHLVPAHFVAMNRSTPVDLRGSDDLARQIVEVSHTVGMYDAGLLQPPTFEELGVRSTEQDKHITTHLRALLAHFLRDELTNPNRTERQLQDFYQDLSNFVRNTARYITPRSEHISASYERIGLIIESLPGLEGPMLAARLSTNLFQELGLPCLDYMGEIRMAEVMRNIGNSGHWSFGNRADRSAGGYIIPETSRFHLDKIIESIRERLETDEIDRQRLFDAIESLDYGDRVIENLFEIADIDQQAILFRALEDSNCFSDVRRNLRRQIDADGFALGYE